MALTVLQSAAVANGDSATLNPQNIKGKVFGVYQVHITGTATVTLYGRTSTNMPWTQIKQYTADGSDLVAVYPYMKDTISGYSSGTISSEFWE